MGIFASSDWTRRWTCLVLHKYGDKRCDPATKVTGASVPDDSARSRTGWCREKEHENSSTTAGSNRHKTAAQEAQKLQSTRERE